MKSFKIPFLLLFFINVGFSQVSDVELGNIKKLLEIDKKLHLLQLNSPIEIVKIKNLISSFDSSSTNSSLTHLFTQSDLVFYKFISAGHAMSPWVKIVAIWAKKNLYILGNEIDFLTELMNTMNVEDSLKLFQISKIYEKLNTEVFQVSIPSTIKELPFSGFAVDEEYFKINAINNGYMFRTFFQRYSQNFTDYEIVTISLKNGELNIQSDLYKREPK